MTSDETKKKLKSAPEVSLEELEKSGVVPPYFHLQDPSDKEWDEFNKKYPPKTHE